ncbi:alcohol dehydrogenase catalytic domain-containing protein [Hyphomicrobium sp.]|uniref:alcohol dehydrogenase catalytic domain-containing protein n=1 Tax=Hyphomicrobium sp. TaxID=82 RepID=UPI002E3248CD|nr:alcohol dehydrogenase catalytic domain-containing protein [Hyphomicrobium sp.]HEX2841351.1 alcohol dehydrogenase catalytic domain-containing protein [Hyphomicrobium sp.]
MMHNERSMTAYSLVPGHEVIGAVTAPCSNAKELKVGQRVRVGWVASSCMHCQPCLNGDQNLCATHTETIVGRHGSFAEKVRAQWTWAIPIPDGVDAKEAAPLLCGDHGPGQRLRLAQRCAGYVAANARVLRPPQHRAADRAPPDR